MKSLPTAQSWHDPSQLYRVINWVPQWQILRGVPDCIKGGRKGGVGTGKHDTIAPLFGGDCDCPSIKARGDAANQRGKCSGVIAHVGNQQTVRTEASTAAIIKGLFAQSRWKAFVLISTEK
ncbi:hypothetical protein [Sphingobium lactosutens]|uniref:Uncharacterized protein n=1 Tax=Sphingobium lactosutens DS20 TaxID=1331060 RepID=T0HZC5_9SPHN|nr:hypothetical protein [Sphingobium lactosutens]EQB18437.1 hypothetical protein RLDS_02315 [Sphingobium lactosutens DS20]